MENYQLRLILNLHYTIYARLDLNYVRCERERERESMIISLARLLCPRKYGTDRF